MNNDDKSFIEALSRFECEVQGAFTLRVEQSICNDGESVCDAAAARKWLEQRLEENPTGWVQYSNMNIWIEQGRWWLTRKGGGLSDQDGGETLSPGQQKLAQLPLVAELAVGDASYHLRHDGERWIATRLTKQASDHTAFIETRTLRHSMKDAPDLTYEVAWTANGAGLLRPKAFRFIRMKP